MSKTVRCPNCGRKTSGDYCQWCHYPILRGRPKRFRKADEARKAREAEKQAKLEAERIARELAKREAVEAKEKARQEAEEARKVREVEKQTKREAKKQAKQFEESLKQVESIQEKLESGKIGAEEAIEKLKHIAKSNAG